MEKVRDAIATTLGLIGFALLGVSTVVGAGWFLLVAFPLMAGIALSGDLGAAIWCAAALGIVCLVAAVVLAVTAKASE